MTTKQYPIVCPSCNGKGCIDNPFGLSTSVTITCPACNGSGIVIVTETSDNTKFGTFTNPE